MCFAPLEKFSGDKGEFLLKELVRLKVPCNCPWQKICSANHPSGAQYNTQQVKDTFSMLKISSALSCYQGADCDAAKEETPRNAPSWVKGQSEVCSLKVDHDAGNALFWSLIAYGVQCECKWSELCSNDHPSGNLYNEYKLKDGVGFQKSYCTGRDEPCKDKVVSEKEQEEARKKAEELEAGSVIATTSLAVIVVALVGALLM